MQPVHILAASDESDAGRQAIRTALEIASRCSAQTTILRVVALETATRATGSAVATGPIATVEEDEALGQFRRWLKADVLDSLEIERVQLGVAFGIPGIEICRYAERNGADLLVLGRKRHTQRMRLLLGDTADAVARRSRFPSLFVPPPAGGLTRVLVALDGSARGMNVLDQACGFAKAVGAGVEVATVERAPIDEPEHQASLLPIARSTSLEMRAQETLLREGLPGRALSIRRGDAVEQILAAATEADADVLAIGYHRGGPPGALEAGSVARRVAHAAPCAVLTIPL
jgi:nucleotide-binding universal stress UspA family protein